MLHQGGWFHLVDSDQVSFHTNDTHIFIFCFNTCTYVDNTFLRDRGLIDLMIQMYYVIYVWTKACTFSRWRSMAPCMPLMAVQPLYNTPVTSRDFLRKTPTWRLSSNRRWILGHSEPPPQNGGCGLCILQMDIDGYIISKTPKLRTHDWTTFERILYLKHIHLRRVYVDVLGLHNFFLSTHDVWGSEELRVEDELAMYLTRCGAIEELY